MELAVVFFAVETERQLQWISWHWRAFKFVVTGCLEFFCDAFCVLKRRLRLRELRRWSWQCFFFC